jgi:hypothetical protein
LKKESAYKTGLLSILGSRINMARTKESKKVPLIEFISSIEDNGQAILKNFVDKNTQFSTKFIIYKFLAQNEKQLKIIQTDKSVTQKPILPEHWLSGHNWGKIRMDLEKEFDAENLNFIEANQLAVRMNEYMIGIYQSTVLKTSSLVVKKVLTRVINKKISLNSKLKIEYARLRAES